MAYKMKIEFEGREYDVDFELGDKDDKHSYLLSFPIANALSYHGLVHANNEGDAYDIYADSDFAHLTKDDDKEISDDDCVWLGNEGERHFFPYGMYNIQVR
jgi:hypothetical protein